MGFFDPEVLGDLGDGDMQPLRLFEYEAIRGRDEPLSEEQSQQMWLDIQGFMPDTLASGQMPGYEFLGTRETTLGELPALAFEYSWDGVRPGHFGGDHACIVWSLGPMTMYHVYHHCSGDEWEARLPEFEAILATFEVFQPMQGGERRRRARRRRARARAGGYGRRRGRGRGGRGPGGRVAGARPQGAKSSRRTSRTAAASSGASAPSGFARRALSTVRNWSMTTWPLSPATRTGTREG